MDLSAITSSSTSSSLSDAALPTQELGKTDFMTLLVEQLKNQDPLDPASNEEFAAQLAQFSSLEQLENVNENITTMVLLQQSNALLEQMTQSSSLIGQSISWTNPETGETGTGVVESVQVSEGQAFLDVAGSSVSLLDVTEVHGTQDGAGEETSLDEGEEA